MAAPRALVVLTLLAVTVAAVSVSILAWIAIAGPRRPARGRQGRSASPTTPRFRAPPGPHHARPRPRRALPAPRRRRPQRRPAPLPDPSLHCRLPGRLAQLGERRLDKAEVTGSSPVSPIPKTSLRDDRGLVAQGGLGGQRSRPSAQDSSPCAEEVWSARPQPPSRDLHARLGFVESTRATQLSTATSLVREADDGGRRRRGVERPMARPPRLSATPKRADPVAGALDVDAERKPMKKT